MKYRIVQIDVPLVVVLNVLGVVVLVAPIVVRMNVVFVIILALSNVTKRAQVVPTLVQKVVPLTVLEIAEKDVVKTVLLVAILAVILLVQVVV
jgi:hypothetical protein